MGRPSTSPVTSALARDVVEKPRLRCLGLVRTTSTRHDFHFLQIPMAMVIGHLETKPGHIRPASSRREKK